MAIAALLAGALAASAPDLPAQCLGVTHPIIDVHSHAYSNDPRWAAHVPNPATGKPLDVLGEAALRDATRAEYERHGVIRAIVDDQGETGDREEGRRSVAADPKRMRLGVDASLPTPEVLSRIRRLHAAGELSAIAEVGAQYYGIGPDATRGWSPSGPWLRSWTSRSAFTWGWARPA
jgi:hypothetical protein